MRTMLGSARPTFETRNGEKEATVLVAEPEPQRQGDRDGDGERRERQLFAVVTALVEEERRVAPG